RGLWRGVARRRDGAGDALFDRQLCGEASPRRRPRCADALAGAAAHLPRARLERRARHGARTVAALERSACGARSCTVVRRHVAAPQFELGPASATGAGRTWGTGTERGAVGAQAAAALSAGS